MTEIIRRNISIEPRDDTVVRQHAQHWGQSFSGALRLIIREWQQLKRQARDPEPSESNPEPHNLLT
jgi:hypothetical protein